MILYELSNSEAHPVYQEMAIANGNRQYDFLRSIVLAAVNTRQVLSIDERDRVWDARRLGH